MGDEGVLEAFSNIPDMGGIQAIPTTFLIDRKGQICRRFVGLTEKHVLEEAVKQLL
jgi:glutathione peroxidase-family protein